MRVNSTRPPGLIRVVDCVTDRNVYVDGKCKRKNSSYYETRDPRFRMMTHMRLLSGRRNRNPISRIQFTRDQYSSAINEDGF